MANPNSPFGLKPVRHYYGGLIRENQYYIDSGSGSIFEGDPVKTDTTNHGKKIVAAGAGDVLLGVFKGVRYTAADGSQQFSNCWISGTQVQSGSTIYAIVIDDPDVLWQVQSNGDFEATNVGGSFDLATGSGSTLTGQSAFVLNESSYSSSAAKQLKSIGLVDDGVNAYGNYAKVLCVIGKHELRANVVGI